MMDDEKSIDLIMRDELHNEVLMERCFDSPENVKRNVNVGNRMY